MKMKKINLNKKLKNYLCFYDIEDQKTRNKLVKFLKQYGFRVQKSVFICFLEKDDKKRIIEYFKKIKNKDDKIGFAIMCKNCFSKIQLYPKQNLKSYDII